MNQRPARKTQFKPNRRRRLFKWLTIILIFVALGCTAGLLIPGLNSSRNASVKLSSPLKSSKGSLQQLLINCRQYQHSAAGCLEINPAAG